jgi:GDP-L-fucose synthase
MPTNLYGPRDNFDLESAHVLPALIHRFHNAKVNDLAEVAIWGDGTPLREFLHVEDLASACLMLLNEYDGSVAINVGSGEEVTILQLAKSISKVVGYEGKITFNIAKPNGTPRKLISSEKLSNLGWNSRIDLQSGLTSTYDWFIDNEARGNKK